MAAREAVQVTRSADPEGRRATLPVTLESIARVPDVDCLLGVLESNQ